MFHIHVIELLQNIKSSINKEKVFHLGTLLLYIPFKLRPAEIFLQTHHELVDEIEICHWSKKQWGKYPQILEINNLVLNKIPKSLNL